MSTEFYPLALSNVAKLTHEATELTFSVPNELKEKFQFTQGQHLTLKTQIGTEDVRRSYSICSGVTEQQLKVAVKRIPEGLFSNFANDKITKGMTLEVMPPQGHFYTELSTTHHKNYLFIAAGSGITPTLSHILSILAIEPDSKITLIFGNKSTTSMMFKEKLCFIKNENMDRFNWVNLFTEEEQDAQILNGRINAEKLEDLHQANIINLSSFDDAFICGPEQMINELSIALKQLKFDDAQIHYELFYSGATKQIQAQKQQQRSEKYGHSSSQILLKVAGRKQQLNLESDGINILDAALEMGVDLPFSCKGGVCATCKAKVISGKVEMDSNHSLTAQEIEDGMILTCQSHPVSDFVEIDFDFT